MPGIFGNDIIFQSETFRWIAKFERVHLKLNKNKRLASRVFKIYEEEL